ncbi:uncharacterized protein EV420DRAFT_1549702 [Desarmillaria tabescens]|uniref:Uncharacterized protein n=1 Tax=Armillaria tabescens TaxID=1929756 RepID=A0AA39K9W3_ARMTA|nr:uncharacterized protein EV420DRAFT_1549702 [Desarmillaria tabescens]KAK0457259.1 hypothetical protein EV420DRAFT_1549702 [Desarmillaria tabescens]
MLEDCRTRFQDPHEKFLYIHRFISIASSILPDNNTFSPFTMSSCKAETVVTFLSTMISPAWLSTLLVVVFLSGGAFLRISIPPLSPSTAVRHLAASIDKEITFFDTHAGELGTFNGKLRSLRYKSLALSRELRQADDAFSWIDKDTWLRYIFRLKKIWNNTRDHQRALDALGKRMRV